MSLAISPFDPRKPKQQCLQAPLLPAQPFLLIAYYSLLTLPAPLTELCFCTAGLILPISGLIGVEQAAESQTEDSTAQIPQGSSPVSQSQVRLDRSQLS